MCWALTPQVFQRISHASQMIQMMLMEGREKQKEGEVAREIRESGKISDAGTDCRYKKIEQMSNCMLKTWLGYVDVIQITFIYITCV